MGKAPGASAQDGLRGCAPTMRSQTGGGVDDEVRTTHVEKAQLT
jgi:hypothetical protein